MDSNLQQYNGTPVFPSRTNVNTNADPYLLPTPGPIVTSDGNGTNQAPVNRSLKQIRDWIVGLRGAIVGDFAGAVQKTVRSWLVDGTGGATHTTPAGCLGAQGDGVHPTLEAFTGDIVADAGNLHAANGDVICDIGIIQALNGSVVVGDPTVPKYTQLTKGLLRFLGTITTVSNPPGTTAIPNQLRALNTPKAFASFTSDGNAMTTATVIADSAGITSIVKDGSKFTVTFATAFDSAGYCASSGGISNLNNAWYTVQNKTATTCEVWIFDTLGYKSPTSIAGSQTVDLPFFGRQTT